jgi:nicotinamidase-related amidase
MLRSEMPVLLIIDMQKAWDDPRWGRRNNMDAEMNAAKLLKFWRENGLAVAHCKHDSISPDSPLRPGQVGNEIKEIVAPVEGEIVFHKKVNSCFIGTELEKWLRDNGHNTLVICGITTQHCVSTTARMAGNLGFSNYVVSDATAAFEVKNGNGDYFDPELVHKLSLATIEGEFSEIIDTHTLLDRLRSEVSII